MFGSFAQGGLAPFLEHAFGRRDLVAFIHVPKTAGSSMSAEMGRHLSPYVNITIDHADANGNAEEMRRQAFAQFIERARVQRPRSCSGHIMFRLMREARTELRPVRLVSMMRDPVARVISDYRYARTPVHPSHLAFAQRFPTIESYIDASASHNKQARFLLPGPRLDPAEAIAFLDRTYAFIGTVEAYAQSLGILFHLCGVAGRPTERRRATQSVPGNEVEVTEALRQRIRDTNRLDQAMYDHVAGALARHRVAWQAREEPAAAA